MKTFWMLAAAASLAACAGRGEDEMGAAPDRGDTTAVTTGADTTQWDTTDTGGVGQTAEPGMVPDTAGTVEEYPTTPADEYPTTPADTTIGQDPGMSPPADSTAMPGGYDTPVTPGVDTTGMTDTTGMSGMSEDSAVTDPTLPSADTTQSAQ